MPRNKDNRRERRETAPTGKRAALGERGAALNETELREEGEAERERERERDERRKGSDVHAPTRWVLA
jgi:hypothetical protein